MQNEKNSDSSDPEIEREKDDANQEDGKTDTQNTALGEKGNEKIDIKMKGRAYDAKEDDAAKEYGAKEDNRKKSGSKKQDDAIRLSK